MKVDRECAGPIATTVPISSAVPIWEMMMVSRAGHTLCFSVTVVIAALSASTCDAAILYVNNLQGSDVFDGRSAAPVSNTSGPTATIRRAVQLANAGDTIIVTKTPRPYYESFTLYGRRNSGFTRLPFTIVGNGAIVDGSRLIRPEAWFVAGPNLWRFTPWRKGYYQLILEDKPVPEFRPKTRPKTLPKIPVGQWMAWKGTIYYQAAEEEEVKAKPFRYAAESVGMTLYDVSGVQVVDLTFRFFRLDGVNAHDRCRAITLANIKTLDNGRAGIAVGGSSAVLIRNCESTGNRLYSVLLSELGAVKLEDTKLSQPPTLPEE